MNRGGAVCSIVLAQFLGTSLWFSANSAGADLAEAWQLGPTGVGQLTMAVQAGFVIGTLVSAVTGFADRYSASRIFVVSSVLGALTNAGFAWLAQGLGDGLVWRFLTGLCLAGIYPLGMKLIVSWWPERAGELLGWLVGMLVLGTALPHLIRSLGASWHWEWVMKLSSLCALGAAGLMWRVGEGPHLPRQGVTRLSWRALAPALKIRAYRGAVFGYFGHMWELYAAWTLTPLLLAVIFPHAGATVISAGSFAVIGAGALGCIVGGQLSRKWGSARIAAVALAVSGLCCVMVPMLPLAPWPISVVVLAVWGVSLAADSPQFSRLSAAACPPHLVGSALAIANSVGFALTMVTINVTTRSVTELGAATTYLLLPGPVLGLLAMAALLKPELKGTSRNPR
jgi:MFS family permease